MQHNFDLKELSHEEGVLPGAYTHVCDWFSVTWHCSHIRFVSIKTWKELNIKAFLAWVYEKDPSQPQLKMHEWLPNCELEPISESDIVKWIDHARSDYDEENMQPDSNVEDTVFPINKEKMINAIEWAYQISGKTNPCNKHRAGPTYIMFWENLEWLHYLEIHNES